MEKKGEKMTKDVALCFDSIDKAFEIINEKKYPFEIVGDGIIILSPESAKYIEKHTSCKRVEIVDLYYLSRKEANDIRHKFLPPLITEKAK